MSKVKKNEKKIYDLLPYIIVAAAFVIVEVMNGTGLMTNQIKGLLVPVCVYTIAAISLNLVVGISGELSLGHAGFMCVGAFSSATFSRVVADGIPVGLRFFLAVLVGALAAAVFGFLIGIPVLRLRGDYLAIVTLAFGEIIKNLINILYVGKDSNGLHIALTDPMRLHMEPDGILIINGAQGIGGMTKDANFTIGIVMILITLFIVLNLIRSRTGRAIMAIRDNQIAAESIGLDATKYKLFAFTLSAALTGMAGALYAHNLSTVVAKKFDYNTSILLLVFVVLGGIGNIWGTIIATIVLYMLPELLRGFASYRMLIYAILLIVIMLFNSAPAAVTMRERLKAMVKRPKKDTEKEAQ